MVKLIIGFIYFLILTGYFISSAFGEQLNNDFQEKRFIIDSYGNENLNHDERQSSIIPRTSNDWELVSIMAIHLYQACISSQDKPSCQFQLSCSHYSEQAIKKFGLLRGILMSSDRLQRCHPKSKEYYPVDEKTDLCIDPLP